MTYLTAILLQLNMSINMKATSLMSVKESMIFNSLGDMSSAVQKIRIPKAKSTTI